MKKFILTAKIKVDENDIKEARAWEKRENHNYKDDVAHLLLDCLSSGELSGCEIESTELDEE